MYMAFAVRPRYGRVWRRRPLTRRNGIRVNTTAVQSTVQQPAVFAGFLSSANRDEVLYENRVWGVRGSVVGV